MNNFRKAADALTIVIFLWSLAMLLGFGPQFAKFTSLHEEATSSFAATEIISAPMKSEILKLWNAEAAANGLLIISWTGFAAATLVLILLAFLARRQEKKNKV